MAEEAKIISLYLSECPVKYKKELNEIIGGIYMWWQNSTTNKKETPYGVVKIRPDTKKDCYCRIDSNSIDITFKHSKIASLTSSPNGKEYACQMKIWNSPEMAKALADYLKKKDILVDMVESER